VRRAPPGNCEGLAQVILRIAKNMASISGENIAVPSRVLWGLAISLCGVALATYIAVSAATAKNIDQDYRLEKLEATQQQVIITQTKIELFQKQLDRIEQKLDRREGK
jgi:hypothetical protein